MTFKSFSRVHETATSTGTSAFSLGGALTGFNAFSDRFADGDIVHYAIVHQNGAEWEVGVGHFTAFGAQLNRDAVIQSSNAGALTSFSAGTKDVFVTSLGVEHTLEMTNIFGDGTDGDVTLSSGTTVFLRDHFYRNLTFTLSGTGIILTGGYALRCSGILDLSAANTSVIQMIGQAAGSSANDSATAGGGGALASSPGTIGGGTGGASGSNGTAGTAPATASSTGDAAAISLGQAGGHGGTGGADSGAGGGSGGAGGTAGVTTGRQSFGRLTAFIGGPIANDTGAVDGFRFGGTGGGGGGGGHGRTGATATGGGGGGAAGGVVGIWARIVNRSSSASPPCVDVRGLGGGNSGNDTTTSSGGGGGGGGGGFIYFVYEVLIGSTRTSLLSASGGAGGTAGTAVATGARGTGGDGGTGGSVVVVDLSASTITVTVGNAGVAHSTSSGGAGGTCTVDV